MQHNVIRPRARCICEIETPGGKNSFRMKAVRYDLPADPVGIELTHQVAEQRFSSSPAESRGKANLVSLMHQRMGRCEMTVMQCNEHADVSCRRARCGELANVVSDAVAPGSKGRAKEEQLHRSADDSGASIHAAEQRAGTKLKTEPLELTGRIQPEG